METIKNYALSVNVKLDFQSAVEQVTAFLKGEGFGILTEIDVKETFKKKLDIDFQPYKILGACNPPFAYRSLNTVPEVGVLLPCNVVVWDRGEYRTIMAMEPTVLGVIVDNPEVKNVANEVSTRIKRVLTQLEGM